MDDNVRRFACTMCGKCCNRSPEVELSEAAGLADVFVFRLMFRIYALPRHRAAGPAASEEFYQKKRLLGAHAAHTRAVKVRRDGKVLDYVQYLTISALSLDKRAGACSALQDDGRCGIHSRRPYACRTVPFHYSRVDALAERNLAAFVATDGYGCDTGARRARRDAGGADCRWGYAAGQGGSLGGERRRRSVEEGYRAADEGR